MTQILKGEFLNPHSKGVIFGPGTLIEKLPELIKRAAAEKVFLISTPSVARTELFHMAQDAAGRRLAGTFAESCSNNPRSVVLKAAGTAREKNVDLLISLGGSSVIDLTKSVALVLAEGEDFDAHRIQFDADGTPRIPDLPNVKLPHIALPTTLSGSEFTSILAVTDEESNTKEFVIDEKLTPAWVILDPALTKFTPEKLWTSTVMKGFSDCLEEICSTHGTPSTEALALRALGMIYTNLIPSVKNPDDLSIRGRIQFAAFMSATNIMNAKLGIVSALRHQLGAYGVSHAIGSIIVLPHCLRWNLPYAKEALSKASRELGLSDEGDAPDKAANRLIDAVGKLIEELGLPKRLSEVSLPRDALEDIAEKSVKDYIAATNPRPVNSAGELMEILEAAW
jgi:alcohol dehydrogenase class IV